MDKSPNRINNKEKKASAGNWGKPNDCEQKKTHDLDRPEAPRHRGKRKKKRRPKGSGPVKSLWTMVLCPFCEEELRKVYEHGFFWPRNKGYSKKCHNCGAREVHDCPCCHRMTWFRGKHYKHYSSGYCSCGFYGMRREVKDVDNNINITDSSNS